MLEILPAHFQHGLAPSESAPSDLLQARLCLAAAVLTGWASVPRAQETLAQRRQGLKDAAGFGCHAAHHQLREPPGPPEKVEGFEVVAPPELTAAQDALVD